MKLHVAPPAGVSGLPAGRARGCLLVLALLTLGAAGCTVGPDYVPPDTEMPDAWHQELTEGLAEGEAPLHTWWDVLNDPLLNDLIERAAESNLDLGTALARIEESRALLGIARGDKYPIIDGTGSLTTSRPSKEVTGLDRTDDLYRTGLEASWEIDLFGGIRRGVEAAEAGYQATVESYRDLLVILFGEVATNYIEIRTLQEQIRVARFNIEVQLQSLQLAQNRFDAELVSELDVHQARVNLTSTQAAVPALTTALRQSIHRLGVLLGERPSALYGLFNDAGVFEEIEGLEGLENEERLARLKAVKDQPLIPGVPEELLVGLPADLLRQRPDIRRAERQLAAQTALIGVATADLYPRFFLTGDLALASPKFSSLFDASSSYTYGFGPSFRWNLFSGGRIRNNIRAEDARAQQALLQYEQTVLLALEDVENSMVAYAEEHVRRDFLYASVQAADKAVELVTIQYRTGIEEFDVVLQRERDLFVQDDQLTRSRGDVTKELVRIYRALGGGWAPESEEVTLEETAAGP